MDFWDLTKVLIRRWMFALPMLLLSVAATFVAVSVVQPNYVATAYVQIVPPVPQTKPGQATADQRNPWLSQGLETLGNAAIVTVLDRSVVDSLKAAGLSDSYTMEMGSSSPMVEIEVVGKTRQQAEATTTQIVTRFGQSVNALQTAYGVAGPDLITTRRLDLGTNIEQSDGNVKRALVAVAGAGLLLTAACTVGLDAWLRRRARKRGAPVISVVEGASPPSRIVGTASFSGQAPSQGHPQQPRAGLAIAAIPASTPVQGARVEWRNGQSVHQTPVTAPEAEDVVEGTEVEEAEAADATIVLPSVMSSHNGSEIPRPSDWLSRE